MKPDEKTYWSFLFSGMEEIRDKYKLGEVEYFDKLEKHLNEQGFHNGKIIVPALNVETNLGRDGFFLNTQVDDVLDTGEFIASQSHSEYEQVVCSKFRFYGAIRFNGRGADTELNFLLLRKRLAPEIRRIEECQLSADFLYSSQRGEICYKKFGVSKEVQEKIGSIKDFERLCLSTMKKI